MGRRDHRPAQTHCAGELRLGTIGSTFAAAALARNGVDVVDGQAAVYRARAIKSADEIEAMRIAIAACDDGFARMMAGTRAGLTEVDVWLLHQANVEWEGEWINARLMASPPPTRGARRRRCAASKPVTWSPATAI